MRYLPWDRIKGHPARFMDVLDRYMRRYGYTRMRAETVKALTERYGAKWGYNPYKIRSYGLDRRYTMGWGGGIWSHDHSYHPAAFDRDEIWGRYCAITLDGKPTDNVPCVYCLTTISHESDIVFGAGGQKCRQCEDIYEWMLSSKFRRPRFIYDIPYDHRITYVIAAYLKGLASELKESRTRRAA